ncbi:glycoside hydrolase family 78 protein [Microbacterium aoyamense]|uniref:alpha-L-rhamnosidase n=1 Tax=Microbacterium aoyamense TaxID=344166 RepID=A0ABN2PWT5_9MICO|nr:glycoside hydrolase family 78 protein [Microbacterium aoyamense]
MKPVALRLEHRASALGLGTGTPRLSWTNGLVAQVAYEIRVLRADGTVTTSGRIEDSRPSLRPWPGVALTSREGAEVSVRVWADAKQASEWSEPIRVEAGLLDPADWSSEWASPSPAAPAGSPRPAYLLRADFETVGRVQRARLYSTAHGIYDLEVNGRAVDDDVLAPGWSSYRHRLRYRTHDLTETLAAGSNTLGAWLADGWYRGRIGFNGGLWNVYGSDVALLAQLEITDDAGSRIVPLRWRWSNSPITATGLYEGESYDARLELPGWSSPRFDDSQWAEATPLSATSFSADLEAPPGPPVRVIEMISPVATRRDGDVVRLDFGQNISGKLRITVAGAGASTLTMHHAEVLEHGELSVRPLRTARSVDTFTAADDAETTWTPRFAVHGFRYAEVRGLPATARLSAEALVVHSDMARTGYFASSSDLLNRFHTNAVWSMRDNFVDLPTDCPQRDERLGWSGDIQVFTPAAAYLYDCTGVLQNWLRDLAAEQQEFGSVMNFHPWLECGFPSDPAAAWGDAAVIVPWELYRSTGDIELIRTQFASMRAWVEQVSRLTHGTGHWRSGFQLGDWLDPSAPPDRPGDSKTDPRLVATAYHAYTARIATRAAELLGEDAAASELAGIAQRARSAFRHNYVSSAGMIVSDTVTALSLAIGFDLLDSPAQRETAGRRLAELVHEGDYLIQTGFVGTPLVCDALAATGHVDAAYHLLMQERMPSWLYAVTMGATTVWERWDSMLPDGSVNPGEMTSFNHYALGAVVDFMHRIVGGLAVTEPGYRRVRIAPVPGGGLEHASTAHVSPFGPIEVAWAREDSRLILDVSVPPGITADVVLPAPGESPRIVGQGHHRFECAYRRASDDPQPPRRWNIHNPEERLEMIAQGVL